MPNSIIGYHYSEGGKKDGLGAWITAANQKGIPVGLKGVDSYGVMWEAINTGNQHGVVNYLVYRPSKYKLGRELPNYTVNPTADAQELAAKFILTRPPEFDPSRVIVELINEPRGKATGEPVWNNLHVVDYLGEWCYAAAVYLNSKGYKFCGPSFNSGEPGDDGEGVGDAVKQYSQPGMLKYLAYCANNPSMAGLSVHEYLWDKPLDYPGLWGRFEAAIAAADIAGIPRTFPIFVTEFGYSPNNAPVYPAVEPQLDFYNGLCARFPQVKFAASWTLQAGYAPVDQQVNTWMLYPIDRFFTAGPQPAKTHAAFGGTLPGEPTMPCNGLPREQYHRVVVLLPPTAKTPDWATAVAEATMSERWTILYSADDGGLGDLEEKDVVAVNPGHWQNDDGTALENFFNQYYPGTGYIAIDATSPADLKAKLIALLDGGGSSPDSPFWFGPPSTIL